MVSQLWPAPGGTVRHLRLATTPSNLSSMTSRSCETGTFETGRSSSMRATRKLDGNDRAHQFRIWACHTRKWVLKFGKIGMRRCAFLRKTCAEPRTSPNNSQVYWSLSGSQFGALPRRHHTNILITQDKARSRRRGSLSAYIAHQTPLYRFDLPFRVNRGSHIPLTNQNDLISRRNCAVPDELPFFLPILRLL